MYIYIYVYIYIHIHTYEQSDRDRIQTCFHTYRRRLKLFATHVSLKVQSGSESPTVQPTQVNAARCSKPIGNNSIELHRIPTKTVL